MDIIDAIRKLPHWRVNFRPATHVADRIPDVQRCLDLVRRNVVRFRGWDYPHVEERAGAFEVGDSHFASWIEFRGQREYWRMHQSGQFLSLFTVREVVEPGWREKLLQAALSQSPPQERPEITLVPGFLSELNLVYTVTEIVEFAARLAQSRVFDGSVSVDISLRSVDRFMLAFDVDRRCRLRFQASSDVVGHRWLLPCDRLVSDAAALTVEILTWIVARFGWLSPPEGAIARDVETLRSRRR